MRLQGPVGDFMAYLEAPGTEVLVAGLITQLL